MEFKDLINTNNGAQGNSVKSDDKNTVPTIHNRTGHRFGGYLHEPKPVISADELWARLQKKINEANKQAEVTDRARLAQYGSALKSAFNISAQDINVCSRFLEKYEIDIVPVNHIDPLQIELLYDYLTVDPVVLGNIKSLIKNHKPNMLTDYFIREIRTPAIQLEDEAAFHARSQYQLRQKKKDIDPDWDAFQQTLEPSLAEEDVLGDFETWVSRTPQDVRYLLIGDTDHGNKDINDWINQGSYLSSLKAQGFDNVVMEWPIEIQPALKQFFDDGNSDAIMAIPKSIVSTQYIQKIFNLCLEAKAHGVRLHAFDEHSGKANMIFSSASPRFGYERMRHDARIAGRIRDEIGERRTAIIYGALHFMAPTSLIEILGPDNCRTINIHAQLKDFRGIDAEYLQNARYMPPYALILKDKAVVASFGHYARKNTSNGDITVQSIQMGLQEHEIQKFKARYNAIYTGAEAVNNCGVQAVDIIAGVYWHEKALECRFYEDKRFDFDTSSAPLASDYE